jgi:hypothetical protein
MVNTGLCCMQLNLPAKGLLMLTRVPNLGADS